MEPGNFPEHRIRIKIGLIFLVSILYVAGIFVYSYNLKKGIDAQQEKVAYSHNVLSQSNRLIASVNEAQSVLNRYLMSPRKSLQRQYDSISTDISRQITAVREFSSQRGQDLFFGNIDSLLKEKELIVNALIVQLRLQNPIKELDKKIETYDEIVRDSIVVTTHKDTVTVAKEKKNFWERLKNLFIPESAPDSVVHIANIEREVRLTSRVDTGVYSDLKNITRVASKSYSSQILGIERQVQELIVAEQNISLQISQLLTRFHNETIQMVRESVADGEILTRRIFVFAVAVGALSLMVILAIIFFIISDINAGQKAHLDLVKEKQLTESLMNSRHKLLLSVSHDIKTPLSSMMGYMEMWESEEKSEKKKRQLQSAQNSGQYILSMLTNLLEFSRLEQNRAQLHCSRFELTELMEEILRMFRPITDGKKLRMELESQITAPFFVETDYTALKQILINIISNAIKYTTEGGIRIGLSYDDGLLFSVADTGVGMDKTVIGEVFKPFSRIENRVKAEGTGLGMYVAKGLTDALGGVIEVSSEKGKGTCVTIRLPIRQIDTPEKQLTSLSQGKTYEKILVFEDDAALGNMLREFLIQSGYRVKLCSDPRDIKGFVNHIALFDIVFTDMQMIHATGLDILHEIREKDASIPVWLMTAHDDYTTDKAVSEGFDGFIGKPLRMGHFLEILSGELRRRNEPAPPSDEIFSQLASMFGDDKEAIRTVLSSFAITARSDIATLKSFIETSRFEAAQQLCHKMHPFLSQLNASYLCGTLYKMDKLRGQPESAYHAWKEELADAIEKIEDFVGTVEKGIQSSDIFVAEKNRNG